MLAMYDSLIFHTQQMTKSDDEVLFSSRRKYFFIAIEVFFRRKRDLSLCVFSVWT